MYYIIKKSGGGSALGRLAELAADFVFPSDTYCICCGKFIDQSSVYSICDFCLERMGFGHIEIPMDRLKRDTGRDFALDSIRAAVHYGIFSRVLIQQFKSEGRSYLARQMAEIMWERIATDEGCDELFDADFIVPAPMSSVYGKTEKNGKLRERLYNHSAKLARYLSSYMKIPVNDCLLKSAGIASQKSSGMSERFTNLEGAISLKDPQTDRESLRDKKILLIDDVCTTGATLDACSRVLKSGGASEVHALAFATANRAAVGYF